MKQFNFYLAGLIFLFISVNSNAQHKSIFEENGFTKLFNGENLDGWKIPVGDNGIIAVENALYPGLDMKGHIGLQHHGGINPETGKLRGASSLVQFRNIWIKEL